MHELQRDGKLDWSAAHFLSPDAKPLQYTESAAFFLANGFLPEELEEDPYIQTLLALGHKVYIPVYKTDHNLTVVVA